MLAALPCHFVQQVLGVFDFDMDGEGMKLLECFLEELVGLGDIAPPGIHASQCTLDVGDSDSLTLAFKSDQALLYQTLSLLKVALF